MGWGSGWGIGPWGACIPGGPDVTPPVISLFTPGADLIITGALHVAEVKDTMSATGTSSASGVTGTAHVTEAKDTTSATGTAAVPGITGTAHATEVQDTTSATGTSGGGAFDFHDPTLGSCLLDLDASDASTLQTSSVDPTPVANGAVFGRWADKSGNLRHADEHGSGAKRNDTGINGNRAAQFFGTSRLVTPSFAVNQPCTIYLVGMDTGTGSYPYLIDGSSDNTRVLYFFNSTTFGVYAGVELDSTIASKATPAVLCGVFNGGSSVNRYNATEVAGNVSSAAETAGITVATQGLTGTYPMTGCLGRVLVYDAAHTLAQRNAVQGALQALWGTP